jgi:hypothetical protein
MSKKPGKSLKEKRAAKRSKGDATATDNILNAKKR